MPETLFDLNQGDQIRLTKMTDDPDPIKPGTLGIVSEAPVKVNGWHQVSVDWADGRQLMLTVPPDEYEVVRTACCVRAAKGDWDERAGGALHCPGCGKQVARFRQ